MLKSCSVFLLLLASVLAFTIEQSDELLTNEELEDLLQDDDKQTLEAGQRVRRDLTDILNMVSSMTDGFKQIPGLSSVASLNLQGIIETSSNLIQEGFDTMKCCAGVGVPSTLMSNIEKCGRETLVSFLTDLSQAVRAGRGGMVEPLVSEANLTRLTSGGMCVMRCAFSAMDLMDNSDMPSTEKMIAQLPQLVNSNATSVLIPALEACGSEISAALAKFTGKLTKENSCWASNTLVDCMRNHSYKQCPGNRKQQGADCLIKLGKQFWMDLPGKVQKLYDEMKPLFQ